MKKFLLSTISFLFFFSRLFSQEGEDRRSVIYYENEKYKNFGIESEADWDSINQYIPHPVIESERAGCNLGKIVFGWHPYWQGSSYTSYDYSLLTDLSYFSYEVDPNTGNYTSIHSWKTTGMVTTAKNAGKRVNLAVTMFSGHATFLGSATSKQTLIDSLIALINFRGAHGVNIDFEGVASTNKANLTSFIIDLCNQMHAAIPGSQVSIALPSVNWSGTWDVGAMNPYVDLFVIMGYDYYYKGSSKAGPVSPKNSGALWSPYDITRSINYYLINGIANTKLALGVPYYGFDWPTADSTLGSSTTGTGSSKTFSVTKGLETTYNRKWEDQSSVPYYTYQSSGAWHEIFYDDEVSLGMKYDVVNMKNIAGIGIWAMGYDGTYTQAWDMLKEKFTDCGASACTGTFTDMGGSAGSYYNNENYNFTIAPLNAVEVSMTFNSFSTESGYDTLFIYNGPNTFAPLIGSYHGASGPSTINAASGSMTLKFKSDGATTSTGWVSNWTCSTFDPPPTTSIAVNSAWQKDDFTASFSDNDNSGTIANKFYQVLENNGSEWRGNNSNGFYNDNFQSSIHSSWIKPAGSGTWSIYEEHLNQSDESIANSNIYTSLSQDSSQVYLYEWSANMGGAAGNRRSGLHFFSDNGALSNRGNSYLVWFRVDNGKMEIYEVVANTLNLRSTVLLTVPASTWLNFKVIYNPSTGKIDGYMDDDFVGTWTDTTPLKTGNHISLRSGSSNNLFDDLKVYRSRLANAIVKVGNNSADDVRLENSSPTLNSCRINSLVIDGANNWSDRVALDVNIDWTSPSDVTVNDGISSDIDTVLTYTTLSANWVTSLDINSGIKDYYYSVGTSTGSTNILDWVANGTAISKKIENLNLEEGVIYYVNIKVENNAGLFSNIVSSDGQSVIFPFTNVTAGDVICYGLSDTLYASGAETYKWNTGETTPSIVVSPLITATYSVTGTSSGIQGNTASTVVTVKPQMTKPGNTRTTDIQDVSAIPRWNVVPGAIKYRIRYRKVGTTAWESSFFTSNLYRRISGLTPNTAYEWSVTAFCSSVSSGYGPLKQFTTLSQPCNIPGSPGETNFSQADSTFTITLNWNVPAGQVPDHYRVIIKPIEEAWPVTPSASISGNSYTPTGLSTSTTYEWKVRSACDATGFAASAWTDVRQINPGAFKVSDLNLLNRNIFSINVYPNPASNLLYIEQTGDNYKNLQVSIFDVKGSRVLGELIIDKGTQSIDVSRLSEGMYFLEFNSAGEKVRKKFAVIR